MERINAIEILFCKTMNNITISWNNIYIYIFPVLLFLLRLMGYCCPPTQLGGWEGSVDT